MIGHPVGPGYPFYGGFSWLPLASATYILALPDTWGCSRCSNCLRELCSSHRHIRRWEARQDFGDGGVFWYRAGMFNILPFASRDSWLILPLPVEAALRDEPGMFLLGIHGHGPSGHGDLCAFRPSHAWHALGHRTHRHIHTVYRHSRGLWSTDELCSQPR